MWRKKKLKGLVWNLEGFDMKFKEEGDKKKKKKDSSVKLKAILAQTQPHHGGSVKTFQTRPWKAVFGDQKVLDMLSKRRGHSFETRLSLADRPGTRPTRGWNRAGLKKK